MSMKADRLTCLIALGILTSPAMAADVGAPLPPAPENESWRYQLTLYGWAAGVTGDVGVLGLPPSHINITPIDALKHLDGALMGSLAATNGDWTVITDLMWVSISAGKTGARGNSIHLDQKQLTASALLGYGLPVYMPNLDLSATVGARYQHLKMGIDLDIPSEGFSRSAEGTKQWIDPTIGLIMHYDINDRWFVNALGDVGGFGVGSKFTAQAFGTVGYKWTEKVSTALGYRAIYTNYRKGGFVYDTTEHGIFSSLAFHF
jgi:hypothetical protein